MCRHMLAMIHVFINWSETKTGLPNGLKAAEVLSSPSRRQANFQTWAQTFHTRTCWAVFKCLCTSQKYI